MIFIMQLLILRSTVKRIQRLSGIGNFRCETLALLFQEGKIALKYDYAESFSDGLAACRMNRKWGFVDKTGKVIIAFQYDLAGDFREGQAVVTLEGRDFFIDKLGKEVK